jgi:hypothetical protein
MSDSGAEIPAALLIELPLLLLADDLTNPAPIRLVAGVQSGVGGHKACLALGHHVVCGQHADN